jgi:hypothetical protein
MNRIRLSVRHASAWLARCAALQRAFDCLFTREVAGSFAFVKKNSGIQLVHGPAAFNCSMNTVRNCLRATAVISGKRLRTFCEITGFLEGIERCLDRIARRLRVQRLRCLLLPPFGIGRRIIFRLCHVTRLLILLSFFLLSLGALTLAILLTEGGKPFQSRRIAITIAPRKSK